MSWVADATATTLVQKTTCHRPAGVAGLSGASADTATRRVSCASSIQARRRPRRRVSTGSGRRSTSGDHRDFSEYAMPTSPTSPISVSVTPACSSRANRVAPVSASGKPLEKPRNSSDATRRSR